MAEQDDDGYLASSSSNNELSAKGDGSRRPSALSIQVSTHDQRLSVVSIATTRHTSSFSSAVGSPRLAAPILTIPDVQQSTRSSRYTHDARGKGPPVAWGVSPRAAAPAALLNLPSSPIRKTSVTFAEERRPSLPISIPASSVGGYSRRGSAMEVTFDISKSEPGPSRLDEPWNLDFGDIFGSGGFVLGGYSAPPGILDQTPSRALPSPGGKDPFLNMIEADDPEYAASRIAWSMRLKTKVADGTSLDGKAVLWTCPSVGTYTVSQHRGTQRDEPCIYVAMTDTRLPLAFLSVHVRLDTQRRPTIYLERSQSDPMATWKPDMKNPSSILLLTSRAQQEEEFMRAQHAKTARRATSAGVPKVRQPSEGGPSSRPNKLYKRASSIGRLADALTGQISRQHRPRQPSIVEFVKRVFGFRRSSNRHDARGSASPPTLSSSPSDSSVSSDADEMQAAGTSSTKRFMGVEPEDLCMVVTLSNDSAPEERPPIRSRKSLDQSAIKMSQQAPRKRTQQLLISYVPWVITSSVPLSPGAEHRQQQHNEDLAALYAKFRSYQIRARPLSEPSDHRNTNNNDNSKNSAEKSIPFQLLGFCESPLQGVEFVPEALRAIGICEMRPADGGIWHEHPNEWRNMVVTPGGREVMHLIWAGCVALSGVGRI